MIHILQVSDVTATCNQGKLLTVFSATYVSSLLKKSTFKRKKKLSVDWKWFSRLGYRSQICKYLLLRYAGNRYKHLDVQTHRHIGMQRCKGTHTDSFNL